MKNIDDFQRLSNKGDMINRTIYKSRPFSEPRSSNSLSEQSETSPLYLQWQIEINIYPCKMTAFSLQLQLKLGDLDTYAVYTKIAK